MKTKKQKTKMHRLSMSREEMCFALVAFRKVVPDEHFMSIRIRLGNALQDMGLYPRSQEFYQFTKEYEKLFERVREAFNELDGI